MRNTSIVVRVLMVVCCALLGVGCSFVGASTVEREVSDHSARLVVMVKFKSEFSADEVRRRYPKRMPQFRALPGLLQKYYLYDQDNDEWSGIYLWDSEESVAAYLQSDLRKSIPEAYGVVGTPRVETFQLVDFLR